MKKRAIILLFLFMSIFLCSCEIEEENDLRGILTDWYHYWTSDSEESLIQYRSEGDEWWVWVLDYTIDADIARRLGDEAIKWYWGEDVLKHTKYEVCEVAGKDYFVITRKPKYLFGATYQVCISKTDGAILRAEKL